MRIQEVYRWEAEMADGSIRTDEHDGVDRGDLSRCIRFSLIPADGTGFPRHDITGVPMIRRFCRGFHKHRLNRKSDLPGLLFWLDGSRVMRTSEDWREILAPGDFIGKGVDGEQWYAVVSVSSDSVKIDRPYTGKSKPNGMFCRMMRSPIEEPVFVYLHCIVCAGFRIWVNYGTGSVKVTAQDHEEYV